MMSFKIALGESAAKNHPDADLYIDNHLAEYGSEWLREMQLIGELLDNPTDSELVSRLHRIEASEVEIVTSLQGQFSVNKLGLIMNCLRRRGLEVTLSIHTIPEAIRYLARAPRVHQYQAMDTTRPSVAPLRVFLCHCSDDKPKVRKLYEELVPLGADIWFDEQCLLPGDNWDFKVREALAQSDVVAVCLSRASVDRVGYVQKEMRIALDCADEHPDDLTYLIPVRLEECEVPNKLKKWQRVDLFVAGGMDRLSQALNLRAADIRRR